MSRKTRKEILTQRKKEQEMRDAIYAVGVVIGVVLAGAGLVILSVLAVVLGVLWLVFWTLVEASIIALVLWLASLVFGLGWEYVEILKGAFFGVLIFGVIVRLIKGAVN